MSIENHPNIHVIALMLDFTKAISENLRGKGVYLSESERLKLGRILAEKAEEIIDELVG